ncbi:host-nuclease inhibitor Gam family protein [Bacillus licheniformis]|nr:host-nuclease inhibitor Gam family protein [Bacillus licheniformis]MDE1396180.1 host-nuclease inhibitor Gam family protein [Bacillus licheniformis]MDE1447368.1 host-nuclease inhibitor Gam family protein [Bacillus licheniformis]MEC2293094.1 host-nuclease inhibitor Gam family protein [Bacillus licheniformis]MEC5250058.1 host-nuclease inhibitor Gam family protein [Bacillus licheniformis]MED1633418.1 host-nuclease inhibitor Gam family protein [Bacillus licheniformis]
MAEIEEIKKDLMDAMPQEDEGPEIFEVHDLETAAEAQRRVAYFKRKQAEIDAVADKQMDRLVMQMEKVKLWREDEKKEYVERENFYKHRLERYIREEVRKMQENGKKPKKTIKLPYGTIKLVKQQPEYQRNENDLLEYAESKGFVRVKKDVDWAAIKNKAKVFGDKLIDADGELIPGVTVVDREDKFTVEVNE